ncbi:hypothetical protein M3Y99_01469900 [Aphelenchoides fujianensis]|nr:hypothetical protein M3Y99_01469900 [Aphelenchoides fujianensis]
MEFWSNGAKKALFLKHEGYFGSGRMSGQAGGRGRQAGRLIPPLFGVSPLFNRFQRQCESGVSAFSLRRF